MSVLLGNGDGTFQPAVSYAVGIDPSDAHRWRVDFTGDGSARPWPSRERFAEQQDGVAVLLGNGDGTFGPPVNYAVEAQPDSIVAGDFTGNGRIDLAVANGYSTETRAGPSKCCWATAIGPSSPRSLYAMGSTYLETDPEAGNFLRGHRGR